MFLFLVSQQQHPVASYPSSAKLDVFNHPDSDDPVAQTLYKMIEPDDKVRICQ